MKKTALLTTATTLLLASNISAPAIAQVTIRSTGIVSGTVTPPNKNPNFNQGTTRIDTDSQGRYFRNGVLVFDAQAVNPNLVNMNSNGQFFVDFRGIPVVSTDGALTSDVLNGQLDFTQRFNNDAPVKYWGNVQDEVVIQGNFTGTAIDPSTGNQYQGTFKIRGQGPRYSDRNGGLSPTVFDFRSYYNFQATPQIRPQPTVSSYFIQGMPVQLTVTVPAGLSPTTPTTTTPIAPTIPTAPVTPITPVSPTTPVGQPLTPSNPTIVTPPTALFNNNPLTFEVNPTVLKTPSQPPIGPASRILLR